ncbi:hypothetical protein VNO80_27101 [Phaseolus coccineus]|uniref:Uncharacterized protein n=1 Tax=Phaseolus coccineus TaxID=3886 RepID=A0AAN9LJQ0_PHACN
MDVIGNCRVTQATLKLIEIRNDDSFTHFFIQLLRNSIFCPNLINFNKSALFSPEFYLHKIQKLEQY